MECRMVQTIPGSNHQYQKSKALEAKTEERPWVTEQMESGLNVHEGAPLSVWDDLVDVLINCYNRKPDMRH